MEKKAPQVGFLKGDNDKKKGGSQKSWKKTNWIWRKGENKREKSLRKKLKITKRSGWKRLKIYEIVRKGKGKKERERVVVE